MRGDAVAGRQGICIRRRLGQQPTSFEHSANVRALRLRNLNVRAIAPVLMMQANKPCVPAVGLKPRRDTIGSGAFIMPVPAAPARFGPLIHANRTVTVDAEIQRQRAPRKKLRRDQRQTKQRPERHLTSRTPLSAIFTGHQQDGQ